METPSAEAAGNSASLRFHRSTQLLGIQITLPYAKIFTIFEGTSEIQRMLIGRAVTGLDVR